ncbi:hypothetical protein BT96DRAFT_824716 [Gymnopus androsaceus JB14]|uniref:DDE-1 domain-containing protein n=1 Tax=Gymnopus androsaceus JB14 TaxID=1447944 RepID=A0A6A4HFB6_9AGAR|nr:hypothetical protein BT96DRAFT_824716 [Gymnopus androsaceus JB14]
MHWSIRKATRAAHKLPENWEDQCEQSAFCKAYKIKEYNIPAELFINSDQTQMLYAPGDKLTWAKTGSSQVSVLGAEEKRAFTVTVGVTASGRALPFQAVYAGRTDRSCPSKQSPYYQAALDVGIQFVFSGTDTYWANHETMHQYVNESLFHTSRSKNKVKPTRKPENSLDHRRMGCPSLQRIQILDAQKLPEYYT